MAGKAQAQMSIYDSITDADFDAVVGHLVDTLTGLGVPAETIGQIGAVLLPLRADIVTVRAPVG
jgi:hemoglobin